MSARPVNSNRFAERRSDRSGSWLTLPAGYGKIKLFQRRILSANRVSVSGIKIVIRTEMTDVN